MTYPLSSQVSAGDATLASHYNNLRADGVYLGQSSDDAVPLGTVLERYETRLELEKLAAATVRVPASASAPVSLLIAGFLCQAVANVDLDAGGVPAGAAAVYYVFANRADDSTTFTLSVSTVSTEGANQRRIGRFYWDGSKIIKDSVRSELSGYIKDLLYFLDPQICNGRLSLSTGVPVTVSDVASSATVYFCPYLGNRVALYVNDYGWRLYSFSELTLDISGVAGSVNFDIFLYDDEGTLKLSYTAWSNDTLRATALVQQDGVLVKSGALGYRYLGTVRTSAAGVSTDTLLKRFVWNYYNRVIRKFKVIESTDSWNYTTAVWRSANGSDANRVEVVIGVSEDPLDLFLHGYSSNTTPTITRAVGIGLDVTNANHADIKLADGGTNYSVAYIGFPGIGYHFLQWVEYSAGSGTSTFYGDMALSDFFQSGMIGKVMA